MVVRIAPRPRERRRWALALLGRSWYKRFRTFAASVPRTQIGELPWRRITARALAGMAILTAILLVVGIYYIWFDRAHLPDPRALTRFELPTIGHVYDANGQPLLEIASEY